MSKPKKIKPPRDNGFLIEQECECGGRIRTWIPETPKDYVDGDGDPVRFGDRKAVCYSCWKDKTNVIAELLARKGRR